MPIRMDYLNLSVYFDFPRWRIATARLPARMAQIHRLYISGLWTLINPYTFVGGLGDILRFARTSKSIWKYGASNFDGFVVFEILWKVQVPGYARCSDALKYSNHYYCCWLFKNYFPFISAVWVVYSPTSGTHCSNPFSRSLLLVLCFTSLGIETTMVAWQIPQVSWQKKM